MALPEEATRSARRPDRRKPSSQLSPEVLEPTTNDCSGRHLLPGLDERLCDDLEEAHFEALAASPRPEPGIVVPFKQRKTAEPPAVQGVRVERTTRFEPATLTLAR